MVVLFVWLMIVLAIGKLIVFLILDVVLRKEVHPSSSNICGGGESKD